MITVSAAKRVSKAQERALQLRQDFWSDISEDSLWHRKKHAGYTSIPRTMPILMNIIDALSKNQPAGRTYFVLWSRTYDESLLIIDNPMTLAWEAGFSGERALSTWKQRMRTLESLGFILAKDGAAGAFHYVLLLNPHQVVWKLKDRIQEQMFRQLIDRANDIGAKDLKPPTPITDSRSPKGKRRGRTP